MEYRHGALHVIEYARDKDDVQLELKKIDSRLFLEKQLTIGNEQVWCVVVDVGSGVPPITILEWRDDDGRPLSDLSYGIIDRINRMERDGATLAAKVIRHNAERVERQRHDTDSAWADIGSDFERLTKPGHSAVLPRSQKLRQSRSKQRAEGKNL